MNTSVLTPGQKVLLRSLFATLRKRLRRHDPLDILDAVCYLITTGCQWRRLPDCYPPYTTVYHHFRSWTARGNLDKVLAVLVSMRRRSSAGFVPVEGRRVVERTFSRLQNYRRLNRNYERFIVTARDMALTACVMFMLRYF